MELRTEKVYTEEKKGPATTQLTFDETYQPRDKVSQGGVRQ